jgi:hypothetical protein
MSARQTQCERILRRLLDAHGEWVPLPEIMAHAAQYNARIFSLRRAGHNIENRTQEVDGQCRSWYRLNSPAPAPAPAQSWADRPCSTPSNELEFELTP